MPPSATEIFTDRVEHYQRHRPGYPLTAIVRLVNEIGLTRNWQVADIGCGTGLFSRPFLDLGCHVAGIEPNAAMAAAARAGLADYPGFTVHSGTAEATGLPDGSIDLIAAAQSFHWFDRADARREFHRILEPSRGRMVIAWNERDFSSPFVVAYEAFLHERCPGYSAKRERGRVTEQELRDFVAPRHLAGCEVPNPNQFDWERLCGRLRSAAFAPSADDPAWPALEEGLRAIFEKFNDGGVVMLPFVTKLRWSAMSAAQG